MGIKGAVTFMMIGTTFCLTACSSGSVTSTASGTEPDCTGDQCASVGGNTVCSGDCSGASAQPGGGTMPQSGTDGGTGGGGGTTTASATNGIKDGSETDVDCGGANAPKCAVGKNCISDSDCDIGCSYAKKCVSAPSCKTHLGGDTCGLGEVGSMGASHEDCCRTLPVSGYSDPSHPGKKVYVDKYEITAGRVRQWVQEMADANNGHPDVRSWIAAHRPQIWDTAWEQFLPSDYEGGSIVIARRLLGDPRPEDSGSTAPPGPGVILPPATDQSKNLGLNYQFGSEVYVDLHGSDCATWDGSFGFPTYYYPPNILARDAQLPRASGVGYSGETIAPQDLLDVKSMNCMTNAMMAAFCAWDGGQLVTDEVLDYITQTPATLGNVSGCGIQIDNHGNLLGNSYDGTIQTGGQCPPVINVNATFDAGDDLPVPGSPLNQHNYHYPDLGNQTFDKVWEVGAPGRGSLAMGAGGGQTDVIRINPTDEPWMDLAGNLSEAALDMTGAMFTGLFSMKYRGIGYGSARSDLNMTLIKGETIFRLQRPEAKAAYTGGRCMRFR